MFPLAYDGVGTLFVSTLLTNYKIISGSSVSCPHVSAVAAILKSYRPSWSPAAINFLLLEFIVTAIVMDNTRKLIGRYPNDTQATPFDFGSGHINPLAALNPGLIYRFDSNDVIDFLCSIGASPAQMKNLTGQTTYCQNISN